MTSREKCPVMPFDRAPADYAACVAAWLANPHAYFKAFGREAREFQRTHRSERLRTMTLVAPAAELAALRPVCLSLDRSEAAVGSWQEVFAQVAARLVTAHPQTFAALQSADELAWLGCAADGLPVTVVLEAGALCPEFATLDEVVARVQWLFLMCGVRLNEVLVQVDPYTDEAWSVRKADLDRKRAEERAFLAGRKAARKAWAEEHPFG